MARNAIKWPNGLGWDVKVTHGTAEVRDLVSRLRVFAPIPPRKEWLARKSKWIEHERWHVLDVELGSDPVQAVGCCIAYGALREYGTPDDGVVPRMDIAAVSMV